MSEPIRALRINLMKVNLKQARYWWYACGRPKIQPFCDGSHKVTDITPVEFTIEEKKTVWLCGCRKSGSKPMCDGTHKK